VPGALASAAEGTDRETVLVSATGLTGFLSFVRERAVDGATLDRGALAQEWRDAAACFAELQQAEAGAPDRPEILPLPPAMQEHADRLAESPSFQHTFATVPIAFGLVELDRLVVYQHSVTRSNIEGIAGGLGSAMDDGELVRLCLPDQPPDTPFRLARRDGGRFVFIADGHDARFLGAQLLEPAAVPGLSPHGHPRAVLALPFGFTDNTLNVVRHGNRMILNNGYHRAVMLRERGITHAPCVIQVCVHVDELAEAAGSAIAANVDLYFKGPRPPMLKDFLDPRLARTFATRRVRKEIRVTFEIDSLRLDIEASSDNTHQPDR
jgi:hypothetical protein